MLSHVKDARKEASPLLCGSSHHPRAQFFEGRIELVNAVDQLLVMCALCRAESGKRLDSGIDFAVEQIDCMRNLIFDCSHEFGPFAFHLLGVNTQNFPALASGKESSNNRGRSRQYTSHI